METLGDDEKVNLGIFPFFAKSVQIGKGSANWYVFQIIYIICLMFEKEVDKILN